MKLERPKYTYHGALVLADEITVVFFTKAAEEFKAPRDYGLSVGCEKHPSSGCSHCLITGRTLELGHGGRRCTYMTGRITPIHDPANIPFEVVCHDLERKPMDCQSR